MHIINSLSISGIKIYFSLQKDYSAGLSTNMINIISRSGLRLMEIEESCIDLSEIIINEPLTI